jgi:hypothetical protein
MQEVIIKVAEFQEYKEVKAKIVKITQGGTVQIKFNQPMLIPGNISSFNNQSMWLKVVNSKNPNREAQIKFLWKTESFTGTDLYLNINFTKPFLVSVPVSEFKLLFILGFRRSKCRDFRQRFVFIEKWGFNWVKIHDQRKNTKANGFIKSFKIC